MSRSIPPVFLLVDISNTFTKVAFSSGKTVGRVIRIPTAELTAASFRKALGKRAVSRAVISSVVPAKNPVIESSLPCPICWVGSRVQLGVKMDYPKPETLGADRLANVAGCVAIYGAPAIVVDLGTAITFDVISATGTYLGGIIAPGLKALADYLPERTALLPKIAIKEPRRAVGKSTAEAMLAGSVFGYRGLVREILSQLRREAFPRRIPLVVATGGDADLASGDEPLFDVIDPTLTMEGLRIIGLLNRIP